MLIGAIQSILRGYPVDWTTIIMQFLASLFVILLVLPLHEFAHGWVAYKLGDNTAKYQGRLTLNPLASLDTFGSLGILLFGIGWAKPVPVNSMNFRNPKRDMALTALAGPVSNILAAFVGALIYNILIACGLAGSSAGMQIAFSFMYYYIAINLMLAVFNLIPLPPLDGSRILAAFMSNRAMYKYYQYQNYIMIGLFLVLFLGLLDGPLYFLRSLLERGIWFVADLPFKAFGLL